MREADLEFLIAQTTTSSMSSLNRKRIVNWTAILLTINIELQIFSLGYNQITVIAENYWQSFKLFKVTKYLVNDVKDQFQDALIAKLNLEINISNSL